MLQEQKNTISTFRNSFSGFKHGDIVIYGTGINAEAVVKNCTDISIAGLMDVAKTGQHMWGLKVLSEDEILQRGVKSIVIVARPTVIDIIYKRIEKWVWENGITVYDIEGNDVGKSLKLDGIESPYFDVSYENLLEQIDKHEVISFDVFDTVLLRHVYEPTDVFSLLDREFRNKYNFSFSEERVLAERELRKEKEPNIYEIYELIKKRNNLSEKDMELLLMSELKKEEAVLSVRKKIKESVEYCVQKGKRVYFVSDMYLPKEIITHFLKLNGVIGYTDVLVSCDYNCSKETGLFEVLKSKETGKSILHIGDNNNADYVGAIKYGLDAFQIMSSKQMLENSMYRELLVHLVGLDSRVIIGMLSAVVFNDPFSLYHSKGMPKIEREEEFGYLLIAPLVVSFVIWMIQMTEKEQDAIILFGARDGWLIRNIYHIMFQSWNIKNDLDDVYFLISRKALEMVEVNAESVDAMAYIKYLDDFKLEKYKKVFFVDFMSRATCQSKLEKIANQRMTGLYMQRSICGDIEKDSVQVESYYKETSAHGNNRRLFALCDFLECILTSYSPSFIGINEFGEKLYEIEKRSKNQLECLKEIHNGIEEYARKYSMVVTSVPKATPNVDLVDSILRYTSSSYSRIMIEELREFVLDDWLGGDKNTGRDALL